ncbi:hypothetical protein D6853_00255 [Butyrivibrio sp. X503]|uniref:hypothetical protein n=1 Tax=Butyrivibrio sp. X503 TaxID=2364878 RepID=UPI000EA93E5D|nr:hypothetical protein [Butyrivibrio sp. X503]RKM58009.1 hypothetical protein D6853_00255 [Butyrivibrio sp. X503]
MAREAMIELRCITESKDIVYLIESLCDAGWKVFNSNEKIEYLPLGDDEDFCWREDGITEDELKKIISSKQNNNELCGVNLFYGGTDYGISVLARNIEEVMISININRKTIDERNESLTDIEWYFSKIIKVLHEDTSLRISYKFEDYI